MSNMISLVISTCIAVFAVAISWLSYRQATNKDAATTHKEEIIAAIQSQLTPVNEKQARLENRLQWLTDHTSQADAQAAKYIERQLTVMDRLSVLETKIEVFWRTVAMDAAKIIHSPDPARAHIDRLLEQFIEGTLTKDEELELRKTLVMIRDHTPGQALEFPIHPGEQVAAAILLRTMPYITGGAEHA
jgi:hypothetical protein